VPGVCFVLPSQKGTSQTAKRKEAQKNKSNGKTQIAKRKSKAPKIPSLDRCGPRFDLGFAICLLRFAF
jgi:hypothetical protein